MKKSFKFRPRSTSFVSSGSTSSLIGGVGGGGGGRSGSGRGSFSSRKASQIFSECRSRNDSFLKEDNLIDEGQLQGRIKVSTSIKNPDRCMSLSYRPSDGRFYAVGLANGTINVYSSKTDNILYTLNNEDKNLPFSDISTTCVRFRPCPSQIQNEGTTSKGQRRWSRSGSLSDLEHFLPPINTSPRASFYSQRRRKSSYSALGHSLEFNLFSNSGETALANNFVTGTFTNGSVKTFNFLTEQCVQEFKENREILTMGYSRSGNMLATGGEDGSIHIYDLEMGVAKCSYDPPFDYDRKLLRTYSVAFHPELESEFVCGGWNKEIQFHDVRVPNILVGKVPGPKIYGESLSFHSSGKEFCAAAWGKDEGLFIFDYGMKRPIEKIRGPSSKNNSLPSSKAAMRSKRSQHFPSSFLYSANYFMDNYIAICGAFPGSMAIVDRNSEKNLIASISDLPKSIFSVDTFKSKVAFILGNEVCCTEIFL